MIDVSNRHLICKTSIIIISMAFISAFMLLISTRIGIGVSSDSVTYIDVSSNIACGKGIVVTLDGNKPLIHYPPLYSLVLSFPALFNIGPVTAARYLNVLIFALSTILFYCVTRRFLEGGYQSISILATLLFMFSEINLIVYSMAWSEPLFFLFAFSGLYFIERYIDKSHYASLIISAVLISLSVLTRYAGIALVLTGVISILLLKKSATIKRKLVDSSIFISLIVLLVSPWFVHAFHAGSLGDREFVIHPANASHINQLARTILFFFMPDVLIEPLKSFRLEPFSMTIVNWGILSSLILIIAISLRLRQKLKAGFIAMPLMAKIFLVFSAIYFITVVIVISFFDAKTTLCFRVMHPVVISFLILIPFAIIKIYERTNLRIIKYSIIAFFTLFFISYTGRGVAFELNAYKNGIAGYNSREWMNSSMIKMIKNLPEGIPVYSNADDAIYFLTQKITNRIPDKYKQGKLNHNFISEIESMGNDVLVNNGYIIYFKDILPCDITGEEELKSTLLLVEHFKTMDGTAYRVGGR